MPAPLAPPTGVGTLASAGSVVGSPSAVSATPGGSSFPAALSWAIRPSAMTAVAMSSRTTRAWRRAPRRRAGWWRRPRPSRPRRPCWARRRPRRWPPGPRPRSAGVVADRAGVHGAADRGPADAAVAGAGDRLVGGAVQRDRAGGGVRVDDRDRGARPLHGRHRVRDGLALVEQLQVAGTRETPCESMPRRFAQTSASATAAASAALAPRAGKTPATSARRSSARDEHLRGARWRFVSVDIVTLRLSARLRLAGRGRR